VPLTETLEAGTESPIERSLRHPTSPLRARHLIGAGNPALERARKMDRREAIKPEITITFDDPLAMVEVLTAERLRLVQKVRTKSSSITALAAALKRDPKSVRRNVLKLERAGVVRTREQVNPGHGRVKIVEPVTREYRLTAVL
jgi:DNA-binding MarR family transcriptional regulator